MAPIEDFPVVCLGGSAGGLEAYVGILRDLPVDTGMPFVVVPHRGFENVQLLPLLLSRVTKMPIREISHGMHIEPNQVFVMPPGMDLMLRGNEFHLRTKVKPRGWPNTLNIFLFSLAESHRHRAVAVILSGLDHDGSAALQAVKDAGGTTFAQADAKFVDMPRHAVETGCVDFVLPPAEIAKALSELSKGTLSRV